MSSPEPSIASLREMPAPKMTTTGKDESSGDRAERLVATLVHVCRRGRLHNELAILLCAHAALTEHHNEDPLGGYSLTLRVPATLLSRLHCSQDELAESIMQIASRVADLGHAHLKQVIVIAEPVRDFELAR